MKKLVMFLLCLVLLTVYTGRKLSDFYPRTDAATKNSGVICDKNYFMLGLLFL